MECLEMLSNLLEVHKYDYTADTKARPNRLILPSHRLKLWLPFLPNAPSPGYVPSISQAVPLVPCGTPYV